MINGFKKILSNIPILEKILRSSYLYAKYLIKGNLLFKFSKLIDVEIFDLERSVNEKVDGHTFYGYYDKTPWGCITGHYLIHKYNKDNLEICLVNRKESKLIEIDKSDAWNYQQGAMLQWMSQSSERFIVFNSIQQNKLGCFVYDIEKSIKKFINWPVQSIHPNGNESISLNYYRLKKMNAEYSYEQPVSNFSEDLGHDEDGLWRFDFQTGHAVLIISLQNLINYNNRSSMEEANHGVNHVMYSPSGHKFIFIHRWVTSDHTRFSRLYVANNDGSELKLLLDEDYVSHYCWINDSEILTYSGTHKDGKRFYRINVNSDNIEIEGKDLLDKYGDGHPSISADRKWIVIDSYPGAERVRRLMLWNLDEKKRIEIAKFYSPIKYERYNRCDLHPRWHPSKPLISIDSTHTGVRRNYIIDVSKITGEFK